MRGVRVLVRVLVILGLLGGRRGARNSGPNPAPAPNSAPMLVLIPLRRPWLSPLQNPTRSAAQARILARGIKSWGLLGRLGSTRTVRGPSLHVRGPSLHRVEQQGGAQWMRGWSQQLRLCLLCISPRFCKVSAMIFVLVTRQIVKAYITVFPDIMDLVLRLQYGFSKNTRVQEADTSTL